MAPQCTSVRIHINKMAPQCTSVRIHINKLALQCTSVRIHINKLAPQCTSVRIHINKLAPQCTSVTQHCTNPTQDIYDSTLSPHLSTPQISSSLIVCSSFYWNKSAIVLYCTLYYNSLTYPVPLVSPQFHPTQICADKCGLTVY